MSARTRPGAVPRHGLTCHSDRRAATEMSVLRSASSSRTPQFHAVAAMARQLQQLVAVVSAPVLVAAITGVGGCVIPPDLQKEVDGGANSPPIVKTVLDESGQEYPSPGPKEFVRGQGEASVTVYDVDVGDTLYVQFFVDYATEDPTPPRSPLCRGAPPMSGSRVERTLSCDVRGLCTTSDVGKSHFLEVEVYDREPGSADDVLFRAVSPPGQRSARAYLMTCAEPTPP